MTNLARLRVPEMLNKVPEVTLIFWIIKIMSTTVGETGADYLAVHVGRGVGRSERNQPVDSSAAESALDAVGICVDGDELASGNQCR